MQTWFRCKTRVSTMDFLDFSQRIFIFNHHEYVPWLSPSHYPIDVLFSYRNGFQELMRLSESIFLIWPAGTLLIFLIDLPSSKPATLDCQILYPFIFCCPNCYPILDIYICICRRVHIHMHIHIYIHIYIYTYRDIRLIY